MDIAALSMPVDTSSVLKAANDLDKFSAASERAANAASKVSFGNQSGSIAKLVQAVQAMDSKLGSIVSTLDKLARLERAVASANDNMTASASKAGAAFAAADAHVMAYAQHLRQLARIPASPPATPNLPTAPPSPAPQSRTSSFTTYGAANFTGTGQTARLAAHEVQNLGYQLNDIFVSLTSGQKPLTVFTQQGSQIAQIYGQTGMSLKQFMLALANMAGLITTTTAEVEALALAEAQQATASLAAADAQATAAVQSARTNIAVATTQATMAVTADEVAAADARLFAAVESLSVAQTEAAITGKALAASQAQLAESAAAAEAATATSITALGIAAIAAAVAVAGVVAFIASLNKQANDDSGLKKYTTAMGYTKEEVKKLNAVTVTWGDTMKAVFQVAWERIAESFGVSTGDLKKTWNDFLDFMVSATRASAAATYSFLMLPINAARAAAENARTGKSYNPFQGAIDGAKKGYNDAQKAFDDIVKQSRANAQKRQDDMAKSFYDAKKTPKGAHQYDFSDLLKDAQKQQDSLTKAGAQIGVYGEDLARVTYEQDLLNKASEHGLTLTPKQIAVVKQLSAAMAELSENNRHSQFMESFNQQTQQQITALDTAKGAIGLTGAALAEYNYYQEAVNKALADHIKLTDADKAAIAEQASVIGTKTYGNIVDSAVNDNQKSHAEAMRQLDEERGALGLSAQALIAYNYAQQLKNAELQKGVSFADLDIDKINKQAAAYASARYALDQQTQALADTKEVYKGFATDLVQGALNGANAFKTLGDAAVNALDKIVNKLLDKTLDNFLNSMLGGSGGLLGSLFGGSSAGGTSLTNLGSLDLSGITLNALGGVYGAANDNVTRFAKGGAFTNTVVRTPTLFRFANGGAIGEMGEAGPEAIMPLKRGSDGSLGVQMHGGGKGQMPSLDLGGIHQTFQLTGTMTQKDVQEMAQSAGQQGAQAAVDHIRRNFQSIAQDWQQNGAVST